MQGLLSLLLGVVIGLLGSIPTAILFSLGLRGDRRASVAAGLAAILASFVALSLMLLAAHAVMAEGLFKTVCVGALAAYAILWTCESARAWRLMNGKTAMDEGGRSSHGRH